MVSLRDTEKAFASYTAAELRFSRLIFTLMSQPLLVGAFRLLLRISTLLGLPAGWFLPPALYRHFVGGVSLQGCDRLVSKLWSRNVSSVLEYWVDPQRAECSYAKAFDEILRSVHHASTNPGIRYALFKPSRIIRQDILMLVSQGSPLSESQQGQFNLFRERVGLLCQTGSELGVAIMIDAEESWAQDAVDAVAEEMMSRFNREKVWVYNTLQMYRIDRMNYLVMSHSRAVEASYLLGVKLVRGAYLSKERKQAETLGYYTPVHNSKQKTDADFNRAIKYAILNIETIWMCCASHNEGATAFTALLMERNGIAPHDSRVLFALQYGMNPSLALTLAAAGYNVAQHIPYGPLKALIPLILRKSHYDRTFVGQASIELSQVREEIYRRKTLGIY